MPESLVGMWQPLNVTGWCQPWILGQDRRADREQGGVSVVIITYLGRSSGDREGALSVGGGVRWGEEGLAVRTRLTGQLSPRLLSMSGRRFSSRHCLATLGVKFSLNETESERRWDRWIATLYGQKREMEPSWSGYIVASVLTAIQPKLNWEQKSRSHQRAGSHSYSSPTARVLPVSWSQEDKRLSLNLFQQFSHLQSQ